ncbi:MAG: hypothetical protein AUG44_29010 [Actinobacteria bacterium 13_1_20CM_3_71_11]|nr:MAG: hypothetical protein AUG44_29010 [Actinobacteria bacterium 13_1_20CM_3_71_11]
MNWITRAAFVGAATAGGVVAGRAISARAYGRWPARLRAAKLPEWLVVTVHTSPAEIAPQSRLPEPLQRLGETVEVQIRPAPGDRGTELRARPRIGGDPQRWRELRLALRQSKQLIETGEILSPDEPPTTRKTALSRPLAYATRHAREEGRL